MAALRGGEGTGTEPVAPKQRPKIEGFALHRCASALSPAAGTSPLRLCPLLRATSRVPKAVAFCPHAGTLQPRKQGWGLTRRPSFSCPFSRLSRGKETMLFRFCTWEGQRRGWGHPRGVPTSGQVGTQELRDLSSLGPPSPVKSLPR